MENAEHAGPGVPVPPSLGKPRMGGECLSAPSSSILCLPTVLDSQNTTPFPSCNQEKVPHGRSHLVPGFR